MSDSDWLDVTPNYEAIFQGMLAETKRLAAAEQLFENFSMPTQAEALRAVQRFLAPLNVAAQAITGVKALEQFRDVLCDIVADIDKTAGVLEEELEDAE